MKKRRETFIDDGRVIADMSIDGMPGSGFGAKRTAPVSGFSSGASAEQTGFIDINGPARLKRIRGERLSIIGGIVSSYVVFGLVVFGAFALFLLFCTKVWFK